MAREFEIVDIWLGRFLSSDSADAYFDETYDEDDDDAPISQFASDMNESFCDHDFMEREFHITTTDDIGQALAVHSFSSSYLSEAVAAYEANPFPSFDLILLVWNRQVTKPVSVTGQNYTLQYLGRFNCDPNAETAS